LNRKPSGPLSSFILPTKKYVDRQPSAFILPNLWPFLLLIGSDALLLLDLTPISNYTAALILLAFLPGWSWLPFPASAGKEQIPNSQLPIPNSQFPTPNSQLPTPNSQFPTPNSQLPTPNSQANLPERIIIAIGLSLALTIISAMLAVYLPGPINF